MKIKMKSIVSQFAKYDKLVKNVQHASMFRMHYKYQECVNKL
jgi:hypothetical protein